MMSACALLVLLRGDFSGPQMQADCIYTAGLNKSPDLSRCLGQSVSVSGCHFLFPGHPTRASKDRIT